MTVYNKLEQIAEDWICSASFPGMRGKIFSLCGLLMSGIQIALNLVLFVF